MIVDSSEYKLSQMIDGMYDDKVSMKRMDHLVPAHKKQGKQKRIDDKFSGYRFCLKKKEKKKRKKKKKKRKEKKTQIHISEKATHKKTKKASAQQNKKENDM